MSSFHEIELRQRPVAGGENRTLTIEGHARTGAGRHLDLAGQPGDGNRKFRNCAPQDMVEACGSCRL